MNLRAQYVGTRAVNQPYTTQVNGYQTVCAGCFSPFPYGQPADPRFGAVTQLSTGANSHYNGLQLTAEKRLTHGFQAQLNYTWSHCIDTVSNGGFLQFSAGALLSPIPGDLARDRGPCDYDIRHNLTGNYVYQLPFHSRRQMLGRVNGWQISGTVFWHSGVPFSVLSAPYSANGDGIVNGSGPQFASVVPGVPLYEHNPIPGVTPAGTIQWLNPEPSSRRWIRARGACTRRRQSHALPVRQSRPQCPARPGLRLERSLLDEMVRLERTRQAADRSAVLQPLQSSEFRAAFDCDCRNSRASLHPDRIRRAHLHNFASHGTAGRRSWRRQFATHDRVSGAPGILTESRALQ